MAKYLKPRRGSKNNAIAQKIKLLKGEFFMEFPNGEIGRESGRIVVGDGATSYDSIDYTSTATNKFKPFITDPSIYVPRFEDTGITTGAGEINGATASVLEMGDGSAISIKTLPEIVGAIKKVLVYHANSINTIQGSLNGKAAIDHTHPTFTASAPGFVPNGSTSSDYYLRSDGTWGTNATTVNNGLVPVLSTPTDQDPGGGWYLSIDSKGRPIWLGMTGHTANNSRTGFMSTKNYEKLSAINDHFQLQINNSTMSDNVSGWTRHGEQNTLIVTNSSSVSKTFGALIGGYIYVHGETYNPNEFNSKFGNISFGIGSNNTTAGNDIKTATMSAIQRAEQYYCPFMTYMLFEDVPANGSKTFHPYIRQETSGGYNSTVSVRAWIFDVNGSNNMSTASA